MEDEQKIVVMQYHQGRLAVLVRYVTPNGYRNDMAFSMFTCGKLPSDTIIDTVAEICFEADVVMMALGVGTIIWDNGVEEPNLAEGWEYMHFVLMNLVGSKRVVIMPMRSALSKMIDTAKDMLLTGELK